jgi:hypothetical protein
MVFLFPIKESSVAVTMNIQRLHGWVLYGYKKLVVVVQDDIVNILAVM